MVETTNENQTISARKQKLLDRALFDGGNRKLQDFELFG